MRLTSRWLMVVIAVALLAITASAQLQAHYRTGTDGVLLPDPDATPGATFQVTVDQLCTAGYTKGVRNVPEAVKAQVYTLYGATKAPGVCCEVDHLTPLELGGSNEVTNLWPEPYTATAADGTPAGARVKDRFENWLHREVCAGQMPLATAQQQIAGDWVANWEAAGRP